MATTTTTDQTQSDDEQVHERLLYDNSNTDPLAFVADARRQLNQMPQTRSTFPLSEIAGQSFNENVIPQLLEFAGSWHIPPSYITGNVKRYANPHAVHAHTYPAIGIECRCGTRMLSVQPDQMETRMATSASDHGDDCLPQWKHRACARLLEKRREILEQRGRWGYSAEDTMPMLGNKRSSHGLATRLGIDYGELREEARQRTANTAARLMHERTSSDIADAYGYSQRQIQNLVRERTPYSPKGLYHQRQQSGGKN